MTRFGTYCTATLLALTLCATSSKANTEIVVFDAYSTVEHEGDTEQQFIASWYVRGCHQ